MDFDDIVKIVDQVKVLEARLAVAEAEREKYQGLADNRLNCMALYRNLIGKHEARIGVLADKLNLAEAERDAAQAGEARAVEEARKARAWEARTARLYKRAIKALRYMQQYQEEKGAGTALSILVAMEDIDDVLQLADNELGRHVDESLDWLAQQRAEAVAEELEEFANEAGGIEEFRACNISDLRSALRARATALRAGEAEND